ncbi:hypothetical protein LTR37_010619 [Vermiconidia calcicola]|uniref:Uncharacterized protein n=1 Tax=Vermiconidia calcicola TaxID=1690605 RepID=A0ACC3N557_9PEZI|nr:hypothetical protein LTR37_010619 [Vermiconidia calcicola]
MAASQGQQVNELGWPQLETVVEVPSADELGPGDHVAAEEEVARIPEYVGFAVFASSQELEEAVNRPLPSTGAASHMPMLSELQPFPPPPTSPPLSTPGVHPGPADTSSVASSYPPFQLNPRAREYDVAGWHLRNRDQHIQSEARDPMDPPDERPIGGPMADEDARVRRRRNAIYHMAMVYRRLMAADHDNQAEELSAHFRRLFGEEYENEMLHEQRIRDTDRKCHNCDYKNYDDKALATHIVKGAIPAMIAQTIYQCPGCQGTACSDLRQQANARRELVLVTFGNPVDGTIVDAYTSPEELALLREQYLARQNLAVFYHFAEGYEFIHTLADGQHYSVILVTPPDPIAEQHANSTWTHRSRTEQDGPASITED